ncbi:MAG: hypothetical protein QM796_03610 [Chthoniobacteraceae bacterium]
MNTPRRKPVVVKTSGKEIALAVGAVVVIAGLLVWGFIALNRSVPQSNLTGIITAKHFTPHPEETQITIGAGGVTSRQDDGDYTFDLHVPSENHDYVLTNVDKTLYDSKKVGDEIIFLRPAPEAK